MHAFENKRKSAFFAIGLDDIVGCSPHRLKHSGEMAKTMDPYVYNGVRREPSTTEAFIDWDPPTPFLMK